MTTIISRPPSYIDRDTDVASLRSAAPSYTSSLPPTYTPRAARTYTSLIPPSPVPDPIPVHHSFSVASWPSLSNQSQSRAYLNVAARRARRAQEAAQAEQHAETLRRALRLGGGASTTALGRLQEDDTGEGGSGSGGSGTGPAPSGFEEELRRESRAWDFFTAQINDWEQRQVSWQAFKARYERANGKKKSKGKGRSRWGFYGRFG
ncbi:hypothetical protein FN846DRAFT_888266 [Sphaerosporella brunnea]|uniref:Uncharacterized protein n=1 Tax=Sphaerosporella brunnea TaxID=1250544 RepID=A0A5J5F2T9_9PEZI|nr:hypothetical protein FN846DRAFT_888266 [Sphaerosporella brunnea]